MSLESFVQLPTDSSGKKVRAINRTTATGSVFSEVVEITDTGSGGTMTPAKTEQFPSAITSAGNFKVAILESGSQVLSILISGSNFTIPVTGSTNITGGTIGISGSSYTLAVTGSQNIIGGTIGISGSSYTFAMTGSNTISGGTIGISGSSYTLAVTGSFSNSSIGISGSVSLTSTGSATILQANSGSILVNSGSSTQRIKVYDAGFSSFSTTGTKFLYFGTTTGSLQYRRLLTLSGSGTAHQTFVQPRVSGTWEALFIMSSVAEAIAVPWDVGYILEA